MKKVSSENKRPRNYTLSPNVIEWIDHKAKQESRTSSQWLDMFIKKAMVKK